MAEISCRREALRNSRMKRLLSLVAREKVEILPKMMVQE